MKIHIVLIAFALVIFLAKSISPLLTQNETNANDTYSQKHLGVTVSRFQSTYEKLVEKYSVPELRIRGTYSLADDGKYSTYLNTSDTVFIELETDSDKTWIQSVTVACEPTNAFDEKSVIERASIAYLLTIEILQPNLTESERQGLIKKLSANLKKSSVMIDYVTYKSRMYNGILMLSAEPK